MHLKHKHREDATRAARLSLPRLSVRAWNRAPGLSTSLAVSMAAGRNGGGALRVHLISIFPQRGQTGRSRIGAEVVSDPINVYALSERYQRDRAAMLTWQMQFNTDDIQPEGNTYYKFQGGTAHYFQDMTTDVRINVGGGYRLDVLPPSLPVRQPRKWRIAA